MSMTLLQEALSKTSIPALVRELQALGLDSELAFALCPRPSSTLTGLQAIVHEWANEQFPHREPSIAWMKLFEELGEVIRDPKDALEWADVFIVLLDLAAIYGVQDLPGAIIEKMNINRHRVWTESPTGVMTHVHGAIAKDARPLQRVMVEGTPGGCLVDPDLHGPRPAIMLDVMGVDGKPLSKFTAPARDGDHLYIYLRTDTGMDRVPTHVYKFGGES